MPQEMFLSVIVLFTLSTVILIRTKKKKKICTGQFHFVYFKIEKVLIYDFLSEKQKPKLPS